MPWPSSVFEKAIMPANAASTTGAASSASRRSTGTGQRRSTGTARHTTASDPSSATLLANSVVVGAIMSDASSPERHRVDEPVRRRARCRLRVGDHEEQEHEHLRRRDEHEPEVEARDRAEVPARQHRVPREREHADPDRERSPEAECDPQQLEPREDQESAREDHGQRERRARPTSGPTRSRAGRRGCGREARKQRTSPKFDGLKMCSPRHLIRYFESSETAAVPAKIHQPVQAPPVAVMRAGHAQDERDAVAGEQRARGPHQDVLLGARRSPPRARRR